MRNQPINRIMTVNPVIVSPDADAAAARALLASNGMHHLPVVTDGVLVGIVSSADFLKLYLLDAGGGDPDAAKVRHIMEKDPVVLGNTASLRDAAEALSSGAFHSLPVVDTDRRLTGIVTSGDILDYVLKQLPRGDGSLRSETASNGAQLTVADEQLRALVHAAEQSLATMKGEDPGKRALLFLYQQNKLLNAACHAAELYMRSGHGEHEHSVLLKRLAALRNVDVLGL